MNARQKRNALARRIVKKVKILLVQLTDLEDEIRQLWVEFEHLPKGEKILGCSSKKQFCEKQLGRTPRAVRYMLDGGNRKRGGNCFPLKDDPPSRIYGNFEVPEEETERARKDQARHAAQEARDAAYKKEQADDEVVRNFARQMIKEGHRALAIRYHPDKGGKSEDMIAVNEAEQRLSRFVEHNWKNSLVLGLFRGAA